MKVSTNTWKGDLFGSGGGEVSSFAYFLLSSSAFSVDSSVDSSDFGFSDLVSDCFWETYERRWRVGRGERIDIRGEGFSSLVFRLNERIDLIVGRIERMAEGQSVHRRFEGLWV